MNTRSSEAFYLHLSMPRVSYAIISDIHSNLAALTAVLERIDERGIEQIYCLGDVVGYGADPAACIALVRKRCSVVVLGNHDLAVATGAGLEYLPKDGRIAALHNRESLTAQDLNWLDGLPLVHTSSDATFVHASPQTPERWLRIESFFTAQAQFQYFTTPVCFVGHTHLPAVLADKLGIFRLRPDHRFVINVGSVGQPRDGDPRACVSWFDPETFEYELERVPYNVEQAAARIREEDLPENLARRLERGA